MRSLFTHVCFYIPPALNFWPGRGFVRSLWITKCTSVSCPLSSKTGQSQSQTLQRKHRTQKGPVQRAAASSWPLCRFHARSVACNILLEMPNRPHEHEDLTSHNFWNPRVLGLTVGSLCLRGLLDPYLWQCEGQVVDPSLQGFTLAPHLADLVLDDLWLSHAGSRYITKHWCCV